ncbi:MAG: SWIM zinc finger family protein [Anaerolineae bacterium]
MPKASFDESIIHRRASPESFGRGENYYLTGAVASVVQRGDTLDARVWGSQSRPYRVQVKLSESGVSSAYCSCPYDWGGWCKHIVATLLTYLRNPGIVQERPPVEDVISGLDREALEDLILYLLQQDPALIDEIEDYLISTAALQTGASSSETIDVDPAAYGMRVQELLHSLDYMRRSDAYWEVSGVIQEVRRMLAPVNALVESGAGEKALAILEAITDAYLEDWASLDDSDGEVSGFLWELGRAWTIAGLVAELTKDERLAWADKLTAWQEDLSYYGVDEAFDAAQAGILMGWDPEPLQDVLAGRSPKGGIWGGEPPWYGSELTSARLYVLEKQERHDEYLRLTAAEGQWSLHVNALLKLGRIQDAVDAGLCHLQTQNEYLSLAKQLLAREQPTEALRVGEKGLSVGGPKDLLASWIREQAEALGDPELALRAALIACREAPELDSFNAVRELAGERWPALREGLLDELRTRVESASSSLSEGAVDIFLQEDLIDDAIAVVERDPYGYALRRVVIAALGSRPAWAINAARKPAESIIQAGKADRYEVAVEWLSYVKAAYVALGQEDAWRLYLDNLRTRHRRKWKLMRAMERLDDPQD